MGRIHVLSQGVIDQIAAGEIIERPASIVKELVENSIDAGATDITVEISAGGKKLIRVADNGDGIYPEDLPIAMKSHTTSKLQDATDLAEVGTLGFRGEALASVASVSDISVSSRPPSCEVGTSIKYSSGRLEGITQLGMASGTVVEVKNLFKNIPARLKFMRSDSTEAAHIQETMLRFALAFPAIAFRVVQGKRTSFLAPPATDLLRRIREFFGNDVASAMVPVLYEEPGLGTLQGYISQPPLARGAASAQYTFLNGRYIRDRGITSAMREVYRGKLISGQHPIIFLSLIMPPGGYDVNVHPTKVEVRFLESGKVFSFIHRALSNALEGYAGPLPVAPDFRITSEPESGVQQNIKSSILDFYSKLSQVREPHLQFSDKRQSSPRTSGERQPDEDFEIRMPAPTGNAFAPGDKLIGNWRWIGHIADTYLLFCEGEDLIVVDQHALHERVIFEQLSARDRSNSQRLLIPYAVELTPSEFELVNAARPRLLEAGFEIEPFGERTIAVHSVPDGFPLNRCAEIIQRAVSEVSLSPQDLADWGDKLLETMACKAAVKAGDSLSESEIASLLKSYREIEGRGNTCPHGRPALVRVPLPTIAKWFKRT